MNGFFWHRLKIFPFRQISLGFVFGCVLSLFFYNTPVFFGLSAVFTLISFYFKQIRLFFFAVVLGFVYILSYYHLVYSWHLPTYTRGAEYRIEAKVLAQYDETQPRYFKLQLLKVDDQIIKPWQKVFGYVSVYNNTDPLPAGAIFTASARLKPYRHVRNRGVNNKELFAFYQGIKVKGYIKGASIEIVKSEQINQVMVGSSESDYAGLYRSFLFADKSKVNEQVYNDFKLSGLAHLLAISGLHIAVVFSFGLLITKGVIFLWPFRIPQHHNLKGIQLITALALCFLYVYLSGFSLSATRAFVMLSVFVLLYIQGKSYLSYQALLYALFITLLINPFQLLNPGLYFSFIAVAAILYYINHRSYKIKSHYVWLTWLWRLFFLQVILFVVLLPLTWHFFGGVPTLSIVINLIVVPLFMLYLPLLMLAVVFFVLFDHVWLLSIVDLITELWLTALSEIELERFWLSLPELSWQTTILMYLVFFLISFAILWRFTVLPIIAMLGHSISEKEPNWEINILDVGHGLSVLISQNSQVLVYDLGAEFNNGFSYAQQQIKPFIDAKSQSVAQTIISHRDNDHAGGLNYWHAIGLSNTVLFPAELSNQAGYCHPSSFVFEQLSISILAPYHLSTRSNNNSCVVLISDGELRLLLAGDIHQRAELELIKRFSNLKIDFLIAPHHGSKSSSSASFIAATLPRWVIYSNGAYHRWNMPDVSVMNRYHQEGSKQLETRTQGQIRIQVFDDTYTIDSARTAQRYWFLSN